MGKSVGSRSLKKEINPWNCSIKDLYKASKKPCIWSSSMMPENSKIFPWSIVEKWRKCNNWMVTMLLRRKKGSGKASRRQNKNIWTTGGRNWLQSILSRPWITSKFKRIWKGKQDKWKSLRKRRQGFYKKSMISIQKAIRPRNNISQLLVSQPKKSRKPWAQIWVKADYLPKETICPWWNCLKNQIYSGKRKGVKRDTATTLPFSWVPILRSQLPM